ncbi:hypothetical protein [Spirillospora sp. NPDC029432]|uniref:hypothetical protein n=1 Tax=Spirillospora sp. NPDC029432 TaxID=3154599 RepID=UPI0034527D1F
MTAVLLATGAYLLWSAIVQGGATREAAAGQGRPGTFLAEDWRCSKACSWYGTFTTHTGQRRNLELRGADEDSIQAGQKVPVRDVGPFVQAVDGPPEWGSTISNSMGATFLGLLGIGMLVHSVSRHPIPRPTGKEPGRLDRQ